MLATRGKVKAPGKPEPSLLATIPEHEAMSLTETARTNVGHIKLEDTANLVRQMTCSLKDFQAKQARQLRVVATAAKKKEALDKQDENTHGQPPDAPAPSAKFRIEVFALAEEENDDGTTTDYIQRIAAKIIALAGGSADFKKGKGNAKRKVPVGWHLVKYMEDGAEEWLRLGESNFNTQSKGAWRLDLDFSEAGREEDRASDSEEKDEDEEAGASDSSSDSDSE
jgi:hypothetical protein